MERLLFFLPEKPQPLWVRYATTTALMAFCIAVHIELQSQTGFVGFFFLLLGIFAAGLLFDRGSALYATALGTAFAYLVISQMAPFPDYVAPCVLFAATGAVIGLIAESLRTEMEKVVRAEKAKGLLLMELAHRTKNNLAMISAIMRLQSKDTSVNASEALSDMAERIQVMAQVYDHLTIRSDRKVVDARHYLADICQGLSASISGTSPVAIKADADELYIHSEQAVPIAIIVNELVTNSLKYAFPDGRAGLIEVALRVNDDVVLSVTDNGVGLHEERPGGVGSRVLSLLTQQLGGTIKRENLEVGCRVTLLMPKPSV
ncbi:two-component sensor histidine kinase [Aminobacter aminovorans]|uniref:histidine kinase n=1 Tax=Aminobacter aminovorans TaxID=83263 RepID=A0A380WPU4_AMIAI|nr:sensor histidine kinase [Aminobacter aminovorans]TCS29966.1 two-component sensor histidine kinase [Aminobacter aminovorans]SUU90815.1 Blue-light-activated histidine kinase 2 [Aminobacter aminovorans]